MSAYADLEARAREIHQLREIEAISVWDEACMMPAGGGEGRALAMATLAGVIHDKATDPEIGDLLSAARADGGELSEWQAANLRAMERSYVQATAIPGDLVRAITRAALRCEQAWREARSKNDWAAIRPLLEEVVRLGRQQAGALADALNLEPYDALLETFEPELRSADFEPVFGDLKVFLPDLLERVLSRQEEPIPLAGTFPVEKQRQLCEDAMRVLGFDFDRGRFDTSHHPFCGGVPDDTRITTRYAEEGFLESFMATCHETGHALYQQGLPEDWRDQPVGEALGAATHESQSLLMELQVCRSREFLQFVAPEMRARFGRDGSAPGWSAENLFRHATRVERGFIRVDADEITYPLHVILRYELERALLDGSLAVAELPEAWDSKMTEYLQLSTAGDDARGCMQDVHWYAGLFGYFPTYTLGALAAAQLFAAARSAMPDLQSDIARGSLSPLLEWLRTNVHRRGRLLTMQPLLEGVTGSKLDASFFKRHLTERYLS